MTVPLEAFKSIPYLDVSHIGGRTVNLMPLWDGERWRQWMPTPAGMMEVKIVEIVASDYVANPAKSPDLLIPFVELMWQRASWPENHTNCHVDAEGEGREHERRTRL